MNAATAYAAGLRHGAEVSGEAQRARVLDCFGAAADAGDYAGIVSNGRGLRMQYGETGSRMYAQGMVDGVRGVVTCAAVLRAEVAA